MAIELTKGMTLSSDGSHNFILEYILPKTAGKGRGRPKKDSDGNVVKNSFVTKQKFYGSNLGAALIGAFRILVIRDKTLLGLDDDDPKVEKIKKHYSNILELSNLIRKLERKLQKTAPKIDIKEIGILRKSKKKESQ